MAEWKQKKGYITRVVLMSDVGSTSTDVKNYIQNAYNMWNPAPSYVLLVGDHQDIPAAYYSGTLACYSDLTYSCVDGSDYYPDLTLGRLPVHTEAECTNVVDKILQYDRTPDGGGWYDDFLSAGYFQDEDDNNGYADRWFMETSVTIRNFLRDTVGLNPHIAWTTTYFPLEHSTYHYRTSSYPHRFSYPDPVPADVVNSWTSASQSTTDVTSAINGGVGLVIHRDHGSTSGWGDPPYYTSHVNSLSNGVMTPVVFSINCQTGTFTSTTDYFCEAFIKKNPGGCVGIVGATRNSYSGYNDLLAHGTFTCFCPSYDTSHTNETYPHSWRPAEAMNYGKYYMYLYEGANYYTEGEFYMFHYFGDPEMMLRTAVPATLSVSHPAIIYYAYPTDVAVTVTSGGSPVEGALVAISRDGTDDYWTGVTDAAGGVTFAGLTASEMGDYDIVVSAHDCVPYEGTMVSAAGSDGIVSLDRDAYGCASPVGITVMDSDIAGAGTQDVQVTTQGGDTETVTLNETGPGTGIFSGSIQTAAEIVQPGDGTLQVSHGETLTATYIDADDGAGGTNVPKTDAAQVDCQAAIISGVTLASAKRNTATISWTTSEPASCILRYGTDPQSLDAATPGTSSSTSHSVTLEDLSDATRYYFEVVATDEGGNESTDDNGGGLYAFTTLSDSVSTHYSTGFESGSLGAEWTAQSSVSGGRIQVTTYNTPHGGSYHVTLDRNPSGDYNRNDLTLLLDVSDTAPAGLSYWYKEFQDENHTEDGVSISADGVNFMQVQSHQNGPSSWTEFSVDLEAAGLDSSDSFYIRWTQYDNYPIPTDGIAIDDISVTCYLPMDTDEDGTPDNEDTDDDGDGLSDAEEVRDHGTDPADADTDGDGLGDGDEVNTHGTDPANRDTDGDWLSDGDEINTHGTQALDSDSDDDGWSDLIEVSCSGASVALDPLQHPDSLWVSFQPESSEAPAGYAPASDHGYSPARGLGWID